MKKGIIIFSVLVILLGFQFSAYALSVKKFAGSTAEVTVNASVSGSEIFIEEIWTTVGTLFLEIEGLTRTADYTITKTITNNTGSAWTSFANELLDPAGDQNDADRDPMPYPAFVPADFSTSNDFDGLSFAQGSGISRVSTVFDEVFIDELSDARDFIDFFGEIWSIGTTGTISYGLSDNGLNNINEPFLLAQRPNEFSNPVPEPTTMMLLGFGLIGLFGFRRKFKKN